MTRTLILVPTPSEREVLGPLLEPVLRADDRLELCGFGLVAAASVTTQLIANQRPQRVILAGIAGTYSATLPVGSATAFDDVACYGIGAGSGGEHQTTGDMGWNHVGGRISEANVDGKIVADRIALCGTGSSGGTSQSRQLLSVATASGDSEDAALRRRRFPQALAEDMEGFAVAMACRLADVPVTIIRGISNQAGDRNLANWQIDAALKAAADLVKKTGVVAGQ